MNETTTTHPEGTMFTVTRLHRELVTAMIDNDATGDPDLYDEDCEQMDDHLPAGADWEPVVTGSTAVMVAVLVTQADGTRTFILPLSDDE